MHHYSQRWRTRGLMWGSWWLGMMGLMNSWHEGHQMGVDESDGRANSSTMSSKVTTINMYLGPSSALISTAWIWFLFFPYPAITYTHARTPLSLSFSDRGWMFCHDGSIEDWDVLLSIMYSFMRWMSWNRNLLAGIHPHPRSSGVLNRFVCEDVLAFSFFQIHPVVIMARFFF